MSEGDVIERISRAAKAEKVRAEYRSDRVVLYIEDGPVAGSEIHMRTLDDDISRVLASIETEA